MKAITFLIILSILFSCKKENNVIQDNYTTLQYLQTKCSDAWLSAASDSLTIVNVSNYLQAKSVYIAGIFIKQIDTGDTCKACSCKTGKVIYVSTFDDVLQKEKYAALGFR
jgi:hypothetical protein